MSDEVVFFEGNFVVSRSLVRIGNITYPVNAIGKVAVRTERNIGGGTFGALVALGAAFTIYKYGHSIWTFVLLGIGLFLVEEGFRKKYKLVLGVGSGDRETVWSNDSNQIDRIKQAIETAIVISAS